MTLKLSLTMTEIQERTIYLVTRIEWQESFCTGIAGIDEEHRQLVDSLNRTFDLIDGDAAKSRILEQLGDVYGSISSHFALEEELMRRYGYDQLQEHAADHHRLLDDIQSITQNFEQDSWVDSDAFKSELANWFQIHFSTFDARLHREGFMLEEVSTDSGTLSRVGQRIIEAVCRAWR